jgi:hypothetical protein
VCGATKSTANVRNVPRMATIMIQFRISSVRSMRRPTRRTATVRRNVATPIQ